MTLGEIIALAKAGYRKQDIDDLLAIKVDEPDPEPEDLKSTEPDTGSEGDPGTSPEDPEDKKPDFEDMYNSLQKEFDKLKEDLKKAQEKNVHQNNGGNDPDPYKDLEEALRGYM